MDRVVFEEPGDLAAVTLRRDTVRVPPITSRSSRATPASTRMATSLSGWSRRSSSTSWPIEASSLAGVSHATMLPASITANRSHRRSASSR